MKRYAPCAHLAWAVTCVTAVQSSGQCALYEYRGERIAEYLGSSVAALGDINGDKVPDFAIGARGDSSYGIANAGAVYVLSGRDGTVIRQFTGSEQDEMLGFTLASVGDINSDNVMDLAVGNLGHYVGWHVRVFSGADGSLLFHRWGSWDDWFGSAIDCAGDVNADGVDDILIGAPERGDGSIFIYSGADGALLRRYDNEVFFAFGSSVAGLGDINDDGYDDYAAGMSTLNQFRGAVFVFSGFDGSLVYMLHGEDWGDEFGESICGGPDMDGDGVEDFLVGAPRHSGKSESEGAVYLFSGRSGEIIHELNGEQRSWVGLAVDFAGDIDGDGYTDIIAGASWHSPSGLHNAGSVYLFSGRDYSLLNQFTGDHSGDEMGFEIAGIGDLDGDSLGEVLVGVPVDDVGEEFFAGRAYVFPSVLRGPTTFVRTFVAHGTVREGSMRDLCESDDRYLCARSKFGFMASEPNVLDLRVEAITTVNPPHTIDLTIESRLNHQSGTVKVRLLDVRSGAFAVVREYDLGRQEHEEFIVDILARRYITNHGRIDLSLRHSVMVTFSAAGFDAYFDRIAIDVE